MAANMRTVVLLLALAATAMADSGCNCPRTALSSLVCGSDGLTYPNECALGCAAKARQNGLRVSHQGRCGGRRVRDVQDFVVCENMCMSSYSECADSCATDSCNEQCVYTYVLDCVCACKSTLDSSRAKQSKRFPPIRRVVADGLKVRSNEDVDKVVDCFNNDIDGMNTCVGSCSSSDYEACGQACVKTGLEDICTVCNSYRADGSTPRQPTTEPTTPLPTQPPTRPPTQPTTRPPTQPTTRPPTQPTTQKPTPPTTPKGNGGSAIQSSIFVVVGVTLLASLSL